MYVTAQSSFLITLRIPGGLLKTHKVLQEELQNNELFALEFSETVQAQPPSYKLEIFAGLLDKTISSRALPPSESRQREQWSL